MAITKRKKPKIGGDCIGDYSNKGWMYLGKYLGQRNDGKYRMTLGASDIVLVVDRVYDYMTNRDLVDKFKGSSKS